MRKLLSILLLTLLSVICTGNQKASPTHTAESKSTACILKDSNKENISELSDRLNGCRFETPQTNNVNIPSRNQQQTTQRQWQENPRCTLASSYTPARLYRDTLQNVRAAVAASRHSRGYYIYTLRHIII